MAGIVVGVDGSEQSEAALAWAVSEARLRNTSVEAVYVHDPDPLIYGYATTPVMPDLVDSTTQTAKQDAQQFVEEIVARIATGEVPVEPIAIEDLATAGALVERSRDADLLVVGSRGRGGLQELLLGSVSHQAANTRRAP